MIKLPAWQKKVANIITGGRNLPDIAYDASPYTGESWYYNGGWDGPSGVGTPNGKKLAKL